jgi:hypothetical protein
MVHHLTMPLPGKAGKGKSKTPPLIRAYPGKGCFLCTRAYGGNLKGRGKSFPSYPFQETKKNV